MKQLWMDWQTFAEEVGDAGQETGAVEGGQVAPDAGEQDDFAELIRGRYKAQFDARVQKILDGRLRGLRQENARLRQETQAHRERQAGALLRLQAEEERIRQVYPDFDWKRELASPQFGRRDRTPAGAFAGGNGLCGGAGPQPDGKSHCIRRRTCGGEPGRQPHGDTQRPEKPVQPGAGGHPETGAGRREDSILKTGRKRAWRK